MYEEKNFKERMKRDLGLLLIVVILVAIAYILDLIGILNLS